MTDASFTVVLVAALGAALGGGLVATAGFLFRRRAERKRMLRSALYVLMQAWWPIRRLSLLDPDLVVAQYQRLIAEVWLNRTGYPACGLDAPQAARTLLVQTTEQIAFGPHAPRDEDVQAALDQIGSFLPVLAFELRRIPFALIIETLDDFSERAAVYVAPHERHGIQYARSVSQQLLMQSHVSTLESDVMTLSRRCGLWNAVAVWRTGPRAPVRPLGRRRADAPPCRGARRYGPTQRSRTRCRRPGL